MCDHSLLSGHHSSRSNRRLHHQGTAHTSVRTTGDDSAASLAAPVATLLSSQHRCCRRSSSSQSSTHQHALISSLAMLLIMASLGMIESSRALEEGGSCPAGWTTFTTIDPTQRNTNGTLATVQRCATTRLEKLPGVDTEFFCSNILRLDTGITSITATTFAVREASDVSIATSLAQIAFARSSTITAVFLGGVYSVGQLAWFDGVTPETSGTTGSFANWSSTGPASGASGCVVVQRDYSWNTVPCSGTLLPFLCASDVVPPSTPSPSPAPTTAAPSTTTAVPGGPYASTPDVAHPAPACPTGWSPSGNTSDATKCYRMVYLSTPTPQQTAADYCASLHRNAALSSVLTPSEDAYVAQVIRTSASSTTGYLAYVGGLYMDNGNLGVWSEDSIWYPDWTGASSPSWPTATNPTYYTNWAAGEPSVSFGCIAVNSSSGQWYGVSCQDSFPFVCAFLNDGVTAAPSTTAPPSTQITTSSPITTPSPTALSTVSCPTGWSNVTGSRLCIRALTSAASAADLESTCNALTAGLFPSKVLPTGVSAFVHAASPMNSSLNSAIASVLQSGGFPLATIGVSFVENGAYGICLDGLTEYNAQFAMNQFASQQPTSTGGCVVMRSDGRWVYVPCGLNSQAIVCSFSWDVYWSEAQYITSAPTAVPPTPAPPVPLQQRFSSLNGAQHISVAEGTIGSYRVGGGTGSVEGVIVLFSPTATCAGRNRPDLLATVYQGIITILHSAPFKSGTVCVSADGRTYAATNITFSVVSVTIDGFLRLAQNPYAPPLKRTSYDSSEVLRSVVFSRRSNAVLQVVGSGDLDAVSYVRFASSSTCSDDDYTMSSSDVLVVNELTSILSVYIVPRGQNAQQYLDGKAVPPPLYYHICVSVDNATTFTRLTNATATLSQDPLSVMKLQYLSKSNVLETNIAQPADLKDVGGLQILQYSSPRVVLQGEGITVGMLTLLSTDPVQCSMQQQSLTYSPLNDDSGVPAQQNTVVSIMTALVDEDNNTQTAPKLMPFVQLNLNHTGMYGVDSLTTSETWYLCIARSASEPFYGTGLKVVIARQVIVALTTEGSIPQTPQLSVNTGYSGLIRIWGLDSSHWSLETISNMQVSFAEFAGAAALPAVSLQCANASRFFASRALSVVEGGVDLSSTLGEIVQYGNLTGYLSFVVPPGMFHHQTTRRMRLCLSIPHPFDVPSTRVFIPTAATVDIRPVQLMFVGRFGASSAGGNTKTLLSFPEYSDNIILPLYGYGILPDMQLFLSQETCVSQTTLQEAGYVNRISLLNISIAAPYDIPLSFRHRGSLVTSDSTVYLVLTSAEHTNRALANKVFGTTRQPLNLCLYAPQTDNLVYPTPFTFVVSRRAVTRVQNPTLPATNSTSAVVGYGTSLDLLVTGVGLDGNRSVMIPALNCSNASTYLWREAVALSAVPTAVTLAYLSSSSRFYDYGSDNGSWYLPLTELQTSRVGSKTKTANGTTSISSSFMWCINYDRYSPAEYSFEATGIPYTLAIPNVTGFSSFTTSSASVTTTTSTTLTVYQESALLGEWTKVTLKGPLVDLTGTKAMYVFLSEPLISCARPPASLVASNATDRFIVVVNATALLLPRHLGTVGTYKLCATVLYPVESDLRAGAAAIAGNESRLQFIEIPTLRINVLANTYKLFTINSTLSPTVEQGDSPMLTVDGVGLSHWSRLRLLSAAAVQAGTAVCGDSTPMPGGVIDIVVRSTYSSYQNLGTNGNANFYIQLDHEETLALPIDTYVVCFHPTPVDKWVQTSIRLSVVEHHRRQSIYNYFVDEDAYDVTMLNTFAPTKLHLPATATTTNTSLVNVVGTIGREVSLQLLCRNASTSTGFMSCGDSKRVMLARPMEDGSSPCFVDDEAEDWENIRGPYLLLHSVLTIPTQIMTEYSYVPGFADPWVLCVEVAPEEWRRPMLPEVVLQYTTEEVTGVLTQQADTPSRSSAAFPLVTVDPTNGSTTVTPQTVNQTTTIVLYAGDVSQVVYLNGFGIQYNLKVRFGTTSCTGPLNATLPASSLPANPQLYTSPLFVGNDDGSMVFSADRFGVPEPTSLVMCISNANGTTFTATPVTLQVNPSRIIADNDADHVTPQVAYLGGALTGALVVPLKTRGDVNIGDLVSPLTNAVVSVNNGTLVMFSLTCMYNSHGLPLSTVTQDSFVGLSYNHTSSPTPTLKICFRRLWTFQDNNATFQTSYETPLFIDTGLTFRVLNISIESISVHALVSGVEAQHDINFMLFHPRGRDVLIPLTFGFEPLIDRPPRFAQQDDSVESSILDSLDDVNTLAFFELAQFRVGRPCNVPAPSAVSADVRSTAVHTATFTNGTVLVIPDSPTGFEVPLRVDPQFAADPWSPYSLCFSVDGGAHYVSAGVAYFTATWAPTLFALSSSDEDATFSQQVTVWEATSAYMAFTDARYDARILTVTKDSSFVDTPLSEALNRFTIHSLWTGFLSGVGYAQAGVLYIPSSVVSDGENITSSNALAALAPSTPSPITFTYDVNAQNINTGVTLTVSPMQLNCLEGSLTRVYINGEETGRSFDISDSCGTSINDGAILRIAPSCANPSAFVGDIVVDASMHLVLPYILPFLANGAYQVCLRKYLPYRISAALGQESEFIQTLVTLEMSRTSMIDQIDGITSGVLVGFYGDEFAVPVTGAGMSSSTSVIVSLVDVGSSVSLANITNAHTDDACTAILTYVDSEGRPQSSNTLLDWFPMESGGVWRIPANVNVPPAKNASSVDGSTVTPSKTYLVCASFDFGLSFHKAGNGIYYTLVPPTAVSIVPYQLSKGFELYYPTTTTSNSIQYLRVLLPATSANATASTTTSSYPTRAERVVGVQAPKVFDFFIPSGVALNTIRFVGNGIGKKSNRTAPLYVALVDTSIVGPRCNGTITSAATAAILTVDSHTGVIIKSTSPSALLPTNTAAGAEYIVCTSIDQVNYFSPDVPSFLASDDGWSAVSHVPLSATTLDTTTSSWSTRLAQYVPQSTYLFAQKSDAATAYLSDMTMTIRFLIKATNASTVDPTRINVTSSAFVVLQARIAASLGCNYPPAAVALSVSGSLGTYSTNVSGNATSSYAQLVALNIQLLSEGRANASANIISRESLYQLLWNRTVNSTNASYHLFQPLVDASFHVAVVPVTILLSLDNGVEVRSSPICTGGESIPTLTDDGKSTTTNSVYFSPNDVRSMGASASTIVAALCKISPQLVSTETVEDLTEDDFQAKSTWSVIPIIMIIPVLIFVGTYQLYTRYFDIVTPEELAARNKQVDDDMNLRREKRTLALRGGEQDRSILAGVKDASLELKREGKEMASNVQTALQDGVTTAAAGAQSVLTTVAAHATAVQETVVQQGKEFGTAISDKVSTAADGVTKAASNVQSALTTAATTAASNITNAAATAASNITTVASNISAAASNIASGSGPSSSSAAPVAPDAAAA